MGPPPAAYCRRPQVPVDAARKICLPWPLCITASLIDSTGGRREACRFAASHYCWIKHRSPVAETQVINSLPYRRFLPRQRISVTCSKSRQAHCRRLPKHDTEEAYTVYCKYSNPSLQKSSSLVRCVLTLRRPIVFTVETARNWMKFMSV